MFSFSLLASSISQRDRPPVGSPRVNQIIRFPPQPLPMTFHPPVQNKILSPTPALPARRSTAGPALPPGLLGPYSPCSRWPLRRLTRAHRPPQTPGPAAPRPPSHTLGVSRGPARPGLPPPHFPERRSPSTLLWLNVSSKPPLRVHCLTVPLPSPQITFHRVRDAASGTALPAAPRPGPGAQGASATRVTAAQPRAPQPENAECPP